MKDDLACISYNFRSEERQGCVVTSRKNWLFSDTIKGARVGANLYSLIATAKANGLEPYLPAPPF